MKCYKLHGESEDVIDNLITEELPKLMQRVREYEAENVFNCDECGLFFQTAPDRTIATSPMNGRKALKSRFTFLLCCNADGSHKAPFFFIGTAASLKCIKKKSTSELGLNYASKKKA